MAQLQIDWEGISTLTPPVVSGGPGTAEGSKPVDEKGVAFDWKLPTVVWVTEDSPKAGAYDTVNEVIFKNEKVALAMKAFRRVRISEAAAAKDAILSCHGTNAPRFIIMDHNSASTEVVEDNKKSATKLSATTLYTALTKVSAKAFVEKVDNVVKDHIKCLNEVDKLTNEIETLNDKLARLKESSKATEKGIAAIEAEIAKAQADLANLAQKQIDMWKLTPKKPKAL